MKNSDYCIFGSNLIYQLLFADTRMQIGDCALFLMKWSGTFVILTLLRSHSSCDLSLLFIIMSWSFIYWTILVSWFVCNSCFCIYIDLYACTLISVLIYLFQKNCLCFFQKWSLPNVICNKKCEVLFTRWLLVKFLFPTISISSCSPQF